MSYKIRSKYINPPHAIAEDYSLTPRIVDDSRYEPLEIMVARFCRGEPVYCNTYPESSCGDVDYHDYNIEEVHSALSSAQEKANSGNDKTDKAEGVNAQSAVNSQADEKASSSTEKEEKE